MTPDQLNEIEGLAKDGLTPGNTMVELECTDVLALVAAYRELDGLCSRLTDSWGEQVARVKELQAEGTGEGFYGRLAFKQTARVAVLREALEMLMGACDGLDPSKCACCCTTQETSRQALDTLDPVATALTERLRAAEAVCEAADKEHQSGWSQHDRYACDVCIGIYAWQNAKGEL